MWGWDNWGSDNLDYLKPQTSPNTDDLGVVKPEAKSIFTFTHTHTIGVEDEQNPGEIRPPTWFERGQIFVARMLGVVLFGLMSLALFPVSWIGFLLLKSDSMGHKILGFLIAPQVFGLMVCAGIDFYDS